MTDLERLEALEKEIGWRIPRCAQDGKLPLLTMSLASRPRTTTLDLPEEATRINDLYSLSLRDFLFGTLFGAVVDANNDVLRLALTGLQLDPVPALIWEFPRLQVLALFDNHLTEVPQQLRTSASLRYVSLRGNPLRELPRWVTDVSFEIVTESSQMSFEIDTRPFGPAAPKERILVVSTDNLREPPPEIVRRGTSAIHDYFASAEGDVRPLSEAKVLLVGDGGAGKTSLTKRLLSKKFDRHEAQTHGINIDPWSMQVSGRKVQIHLWDFGGQEIMHATHLFFLSQRSLYVLVLDGRKEEDAEYWLKHIESFGGDSPILVVLNKMDQNPAFDVNRRFLQKKYESIVGFYRLSCSTGAGLEEFRAGMQAGMERVQTLQTMWPASWFRVKERLASLPNHYISHDEYDGICAEAEIGIADQRKTLVQFLHDLGAVVHFGDFGLTHMHVLEPRWLTAGVYAIVNDPGLAERKGVLPLDTVGNILGGNHGGFAYPAHTHPYIIELMRKFELCYAIDAEAVLVPDLLDIQEPEIEFDDEGDLRVRLDYDFMPRSVMPRFMVKRHREIRGDLRWRTGVVLEHPAFSARAVVRADEDAKQITIHVTGDQRRDYMTILRATFVEINGSFEKLKVQERLCLPDAPDVTVGYDHLLQLEKEGRNEVYPEGATHPYNVSTLLGSLAVESAHSEEDFLRMLRVVFAENDTRETLAAKANHIAMLQPNFCGVGVNINALIERVMSGRKPRKADAPMKGRG